jgi:hypothetical protein
MTRKAAAPALFPPDLSMDDNHDRKLLSLPLYALENDVNALAVALGWPTIDVLRAHSVTRIRWSTTKGSILLSKQSFDLYRWEELVKEGWATVAPTSEKSSPRKLLFTVTPLGLFVCKARLQMEIALAELNRSRKGP